MKVCDDKLSLFRFGIMFTKSCLAKRIHFQAWIKQKKKIGKLRERCILISKFSSLQTLPFTLFNRILFHSNYFTRDNRPFPLRISRMNVCEFPQMWHNTHSFGGESSPTVVTIPLPDFQEQAELDRPKTHLSPFYFFFNLFFLAPLEEQEKTGNAFVTNKAVALSFSLPSPFLPSPFLPRHVVRSPRVRKICSCLRNSSGEREPKAKVR